MNKSVDNPLNEWYYIYRKEVRQMDIIKSLIDMITSILSLAASIIAIIAIKDRKKH